MLELLYSNKLVVRILFLLFVALSLSVSGLAVSLFSADFDKAYSSAVPWMTPVITEEELRAMDWVRANSNERDVFVEDIFGGEFLMGQTLREGTEGGDWAIIPNVVERMSKIDEFYKTDSADKAYEIAKEHNAKFVVIQNRQVFAGFSWMHPEKSKMQDSRFFELVYEDNGFEIYRVK